MITVDLQQDAIHFSAGSTEKKSKRLVRNYRLILRSTKCRVNRVRECRIFDMLLYTAARERGINDSFLTINLRVRGFTGSVAWSLPIWWRHYEAKLNQRTRVVISFTHGMFLIVRKTKLDSCFHIKNNIHLIKSS